MWPFQCRFDHSGHSWQKHYTFTFCQSKAYIFVQWYEYIHSFFLLTWLVQLINHSLKLCKQYLEKTITKVNVEAWFFESHFKNMLPQSKSNLSRLEKKFVYFDWYDNKLHNWIKFKTKLNIKFFWQIQVSLIAFKFFFTVSFTVSLKLAPSGSSYLYSFLTHFIIITF